MFLINLKNTLMSKYNINMKNKNNINNLLKAIWGFNNYSLIILPCQINALNFH